MAGKLKLLVCCGNGTGTSTMVKLSVEKVTKKIRLGIQEIRCCVVSGGKSAVGQYDIILCSENFVNMFTDAEKRGTKIVGLKSVISAKEIEKGLTAAISK